MQMRRPKKRRFKRFINDISRIFKPDFGSRTGRSSVMFVIVGIAAVVLIVTPIIVITSSNATAEAAQQTATAEALTQAVNFSDVTEIEYETLSYGDENPDVETLQVRLMELHYMEQNEPTQKFGGITEGAVKLFQRQSELEVTGVADAQTLKLIYAENAPEYAARQGDTGADVETIQHRLYELAYLDRVTGNFGEMTTSAVEELQKKNKLDPTGEVNYELIELMFSPDVKSNALTQGAPESEQVKTYQTKLKSLAYLEGTPDGKFGPGTAKAVRSFQDKNGLVVDGALGPNTISLLMSGDAEPYKLSIGSRGDDVKQMQNRLRVLKYLKSTDGYFGANTELAIRNFQKTNKLSADGKAGKLTLEKLNSDSAKECPDNLQNPSATPKPASGSTAKPTTNPNIGAPSDTSVASLLAVARSKIGSPYLLGAKGPDKFDCSGFVFWCINQIGIKQSYMTSAQWQKVTKYPRIERMEDLKPGDIISFKGHVGICSGNGVMVDASDTMVERTYNTSYWKTNFVCGFRIM